MKTIPYKLDKTRNIKMGLRALDTIEKELGKLLSEIEWDKMSIREAVTILWAGLVWEDTELTVDDLMDLVDEYSSTDEMYAVLGSAQSDSNPPEDKEGGKKN